MRRSIHSPMYLLRQDIDEDNEKPVYPLRLDHSEAGVSTSPLKKTRRSRTSTRQSRNHHHSHHKHRDGEKILLPAENSASFIFSPSKGPNADEILEDSQIAGTERITTSTSSPILGTLNDDAAPGGFADFMEEDANKKSDEIYGDAVDEGHVGFKEIGGGIYVVEGWSIAAREGTNRWYHFQAMNRANELVVVCMCPQGASNCIHQRYYQNSVSIADFTWTEEGTKAKVVRFDFLSLGDEDGRAIHRFSVGKGGDTTSIHGRVIVEYEGTYRGDGRWKCVKDSIRCTHINSAKKYLQKGLREIEDDSDDGEEPEQLGRMEDEGIDVVDKVIARGDAAISHWPILAPTWCRLSTDALLYDQPPPMRLVPELLPLLQGAGSCACVDGCRAWYNWEQPKIIKECTAYTLTRSYKTRIELQQCPRCPKLRRRYIGPETRNIGLFNYNNSSLFSHELLDEYTSAFSCSETPFDPWVIQVKRRYSLNSDEGAHFVSGGLFRDAWFAYARLMNLEGDKYCSLCGKSPDNVIWDGVTLAYGRKHLESSLRPPTTQDADASERRRFPSSRKEWLVEPTERRRLHRWIQRGGLGYEGSPDKDKERDEASMMERRLDYPAIQEYLYSVDKSLGDLFARYLGSLETVTEKGKWRPKQRFKAFFEILSADESTLQTVNRESLQALHAFNMKPSQDTASRLIGIPMLYHILREDFDKHSGYSMMVRGVCNWMYRRSYEVFTLVMRGVTSPMPLLEETTTKRKDSWETTGCCYGMPEIRKRPKYPGIVNDGQVDVNKDRGGTCSKYYESYGKRKLTGGIMVCWCTHSICYGFHCIPESEGRNDVFSAMITRWEKAPKRVIYDFACSLGPYCMTREPEFFADTKFMVDGFHAYGHTRCSSASFVKSYMDVDSTMAGLNSSAAECGNNGIRRIRKSVSYMKQIHAIIYTWVFLSVWNRMKIKKMEMEMLT